MARLDLAFSSNEEIFRICHTCDGCGFVLRSPGGGSSPWNFLTPEAQVRLKENRQPCPNCQGMGRTSDDSSLLGFIVASALTELGTVPLDEMTQEAREKHETAYHLTWALWAYYHPDSIDKGLRADAMLNAAKKAREISGRSEEREGRNDRVSR